jgi:cytoskeletal protein RodZ
MDKSGFHVKVIPEKQSFNEQLKVIRRKKQLSLSNVEQETKIRAHYLEAIEDGRLDLLPPAYSKGYIRRYAEFLGVAKETIEHELELLIQQQPKKQPFSPRGMGKEHQWSITPKIITTVFSLIVLIGFIGYVTYQVRQFAAPPVLEVTKPTTDSVVTLETFAIEGRTEPGATVYVDSLQASTGSDGAFSYLLTLRPGLNQITIRAENRIKKQTTKIVSVLYQPGASPTPPATPPPLASPQTGDVNPDGFREENQ